MLALDEQKRAYLRAMGITLWEMRSTQPPEEPAVVHAKQAEAVQEAPPAAAPAEAKPVQPAKAAAPKAAPPVKPKPTPPARKPSRSSGADYSVPVEQEEQSAPVWLDGAAPNDAPPPFEDVPLPEEVPAFLLEEEEDGAAGPPPVATLDWDALKARVAECQACDLCKSRKQTVFARGDEKADWMIIGEAPGADEDRMGEPFVGRAGKLLDEVLYAAGLPRNSAYIANILKCRPPGNRDPKPEEAALCEAYLQRQIALVQPKLILCVGRIAAQNLLKTEQSTGRLRGKLHQFGDARIPVVVTYHPSYLLRQPREKRKVWDDLKLAMQTMAERS